MINNRFIFKACGFILLGCLLVDSGFSSPDPVGNGAAQAVSRLAFEAGDPILLERARERALPVVENLMQTLEGRLRQAMSEGGPEAAIKVCQDQAITLTQAVREEHGIEYLKRVGIRVRNPENAPDPAEKRALKYFLKIDGKAGGFPLDWVDVVRGDPGHQQVRYYRSISMLGRCLPCHGPADSMPDQIRKVIDKQYPNDAARDFEIGDLRGLMVVGLKPDLLKNKE